jgi:predicted DNA-binding transcriptional regulator AlpA
MDQKILSNDEAARFLGLSPRTLPGMRLRGDGPPFIRLGARRVGYLESDISAWVESQRRRSTSDPGEDRPHFPAAKPALNAQAETGVVRND